MGLEPNSEVKASDWNERIFSVLDAKLQVLFSGCSPFYSAMINRFPALPNKLFSVILFHSVGATLFPSGFADPGSNYSNIPADVLRDVLTYDEAVEYGGNVNHSGGSMLGWVNVKYIQGAADLVFENVSSFDFDQTPNRFGLYRIHNISNAALTVSFPAGEVVVPARGIQAIRVTESAVTIEPYKYIWEMLPGDPIIWDVASPWHQANNALCPVRVLDWLEYFRSQGRMNFGFFFDGPSDDLRSLYTAYFGDQLSPSTKIGDLIHFKGVFTHKGTAYSFNGYDTIEDDLASEDIAVTYDANGWLIDGEGSATQVTTNLLGTASVDLPFRPQFEFELDFAPVHLQPDGDEFFFDRDYSTPIIVRTSDTLQAMYDRLSTEGYTVESKGLDENGFYWVCLKTIDYSDPVRDDSPDIGPIGPIEEAAEWANQQVNRFEIESSGYKFRAIARFKDSGFPSSTDRRLWAYPRLPIANVGTKNPYHDRELGFVWDEMQDGAGQVRHLGAITPTEIPPDGPGIDATLTAAIYRYAGPSHPLLTTYVAVPLMVEQFRRMENLVARASRCFPLQLSDIYGITQQDNAFSAVPAWLGEIVPTGFFASYLPNLSRWVDDFNIPPSDQTAWAEASQIVEDARKYEDLIISGIPVTTEYHTETYYSFDVFREYSNEVEDGGTFTRDEDVSVVNTASGSRSRYEELPIDFDLYGQEITFYAASDILAQATQFGMPQLYARVGVPLATTYFDDDSATDATYTRSPYTVSVEYGSAPADWLDPDKTTPLEAYYPKDAVRLVPSTSGFHFISTSGTRFATSTPLHTSRIEDEVFRRDEDGAPLIAISKNSPLESRRTEEGKIGTRCLEWEATPEWVNNSKVICHKINYQYKADRWNETPPWDDSLIDDLIRQSNYLEATTSPMIFGDDMDGQQYAYVYLDFYVNC